MVEGPKNVAIVARPYSMKWVGSGHETNAAGAKYNNKYRLMKHGMADCTYILALSAIQTITMAPYIAAFVRTLNPFYSKGAIIINIFFIGPKASCTLIL